MASINNCTHDPVGFRFTSNDKNILIAMTICRHCKTELDHTCIPPTHPPREMIESFCRALCEVLASLPFDRKSIPQIKTPIGTFDAFLAPLDIGDLGRL